MKRLNRLKTFWWSLGGRRNEAETTAQVSKDDLLKYLPSNPVIVEAGAHTGHDTEELSRQWPAGTIYAFEPVPHLFTKLQSRTRSLRNVFLSREALSDRNGQSTLHLSEGQSDGSSSLLPPEQHLEVHPEVKFERTINVSTITLDSWAKKIGVNRVDFMWLDMQGMEPAVLRASPKILETVTAIHSEVSLLPVYAHATLYPEFRVWMEQQGFVVTKEVLPYPDMGNVLFVRKP